MLNMISAAVMLVMIELSTGLEDVVIYGIENQQVCADILKQTYTPKGYEYKCRPEGPVNSTKKTRTSA